jgi:hypothetical protein
MLFGTSTELHAHTVTDETKDDTALLAAETSFIVRTVTALQWQRSELPHVTSKLEVFL